MYELHRKKIEDKKISAFGDLFPLLKLLASIGHFSTVLGPTPTPWGSISAVFGLLRQTLSKFHHTRLF